MDISLLRDTAGAMVADGKGILAADESTRTISARFESLGIKSTEDSRRDYRELLFRTEGVGEFISGAILYDETIRQTASDGMSMVDVLQGQNMLPGIKVDTGTTQLAGAPGELVTEGLDGLRQRLHEYFDIGARFAKWRAVITIGDSIPSEYCIKANAHLLARYAALCQEANLVPIVEPEVLMEGGHDIVHCFEATSMSLSTVFNELVEQRVDLTGIILKPNMVLSGKDSSTKAGPDEVAEKTIDCFLKTIPVAVAGIAFLSGGQSDTDATTNLNAITNRASQLNVPWPITFSYGRGLQSLPLSTWLGEKANAGDAQKAFYQRARLTSAARCGSYSSEMEKGDL